MNQKRSVLDARISETGALAQVKKGFVGGVLATLIMTVFLLLGMFMNGSPYPQPVPLAIVERVAGAALPGAAVVIVGSICHLLYGGAWAGIFALAAQPVSEAKGVALGLLLWLVEQVVVVPLLGWGVFGAQIVETIAVNSVVILAGTSLFFHLIYGLAVGMLLNQTTSYEIFTRPPEDES